jgi:hypothetical protein
LILLLPADARSAVAESWREAVGDYATLIWRSALGDCVEENELDAHEYA